jgi:hypothetical protein
MMCLKSNPFVPSTSRDVIRITSLEVIIAYDVKWKIQDIVTRRSRQGKILLRATSREGAEKKST